MENQMIRMASILSGINLDNSENIFTKNRAIGFLISLWLPFVTPPIMGPGGQSAD